MRSPVDSKKATVSTFARPPVSASEKGLGTKGGQHAGAIFTSPNQPVEKGASMSDEMKPSVSRGEALKRLSATPVIVLGVAATMSAAEAADTKKQFKYQDKPSKTGQKCSGCRLFRPPSGCQVVTGKISPNGWCTAWVKR